MLLHMKSTFTIDITPLV